MNIDKSQNNKLEKFPMLPFLWIDFLGFGELLLNEVGKLNQMPDLLFDRVLPHEIRTQTAMFQYILLSDTLVLCPGENRAPDDNIYKQLRDIARVAYHILGKSIRNLVPIRGTLAYGAITFKLEKGQSMALGSGVIDAYHLEKKQNWIGIAVSPESLRLLRLDYPDINVETVCDNILCLYKDIPMKNQKASTMQGYAVRPHGDIDILKQRLRQKMLESPIGSQIKYQNTIDFMNYLKELK